jgi:hypothetical protein
LIYRFAWDKQKDLEQSKSEAKNQKQKQIKPPLYLKRRAFRMTSSLCFYAFMLLS